MVSLETKDGLPAASRWEARSPPSGRKWLPVFGSVFGCVDKAPCRRLLASSPALSGRPSAIPAVHMAVFKVEFSMELISLVVVSSSSSLQNVNS